jgi:serine/threonine protein kinase
MPVAAAATPVDVLSPRNPNIPARPRAAMNQESKPKPKAKVEEKNVNPDKIDDKWRPPTQVTEPGPHPETYLTGRKLGKGGFAVCFEATVKSTKAQQPQLVALKVVKARIEQKKMAEKFRTELQIHAKMCHPNIVGFHRAFNFNEHTYVVLELCHNGNLNDMVKGRGCLSLPEVRRYMIQICGGVKYMHKRSVIHRDLKMGNIFLDNEMNVKIGDFGLAAVMVDDQDRRTTLCGTPNYIAPEILSKSGTRGHDNKVDTWAIGVITYAMLIGTPPFQSKTQQEIYQKLRTLEYEWKIDSKNYIPQEAKDLVASCLNLDSTKRPDMDEIVHHGFFSKPSFTIASQLDPACLKDKPTWLKPLDPRGDCVDQGIGISYQAMCQQCGVGIMTSGASRPAVGEKANISTIVEIEAENRRDCAPTMPLSDGVIYKHFAEAAADWTVHRQHPIQPSRRVQKLASATAGAIAANLIEIAASAAPSTASNSMLPPARPLSMNRPVQSFAAQQRQQALPTHALPRQADAPNAIITEASNETPPLARDYLRERPVRSASVRNLRSNSTRDAATELKPTLPKSNTISGGISSHQNNRTTEQPILRSRLTGRSKPKQEAIGALTSLQAQLEGPMPTKTAMRGSEITITGKKLSDFSEVPSMVLRETSGNDRRPTQPAAEDTTKPLRRALKATSVRESEKSTKSITSSAVPLLQPKPSLISSSDPYTVVPRSSPLDTLTLLETLYEALSPLSIATVHPTFKKSKYDHRPRVERWVDYTTKHGIAYLLSEETVGMVLMSNADKTRASCSMVIRNGRDFILARAKGAEAQVVPQGRGAAPVEFFEQAGEEGTRMLSLPARHFKIDISKNQDEAAALKQLSSNCDRYQAERLSLVSIADKFGKYMAKKTGADDDCAEKDQCIRGTHINFYQRLGNVGIWRFGDGATQVNFPDHTKAIMYQKEDMRGEKHWMVDIVYLDSEDAMEIKDRETQPESSYERRSQVTWRLQDVVLGDLKAYEKAIVRSNEIKEKLQWIRAVIGRWLKEGGLGRMGDEKVGWTGIGYNLDRVKMTWCTVGREGGDWEGRYGKERSVS